MTERGPLLSGGALRRVLPGLAPMDGAQTRWVVWYHVAEVIRYRIVRALKYIYARGVCRPSHHAAPGAG